MPRRLLILGPLVVGVLALTALPPSTAWSAAPLPSPAAIRRDPARPGPGRVRIRREDGPPAAHRPVGQGDPPPSDFTIDTITAQRSITGEPALYAQVHNTGGRALDLSGTLKLTSVANAMTAGPFPVKGGTILAPGDSGAITVTLNRRVPDGPWVARVTLRSGPTERTARATVTFPLPGGTAAPVMAETNSRVPALLVAAVAFAALAALGVALLLWQRRPHPPAWSRGVRRSGRRGRGPV
ncbi:hypothetical protein [Sphaerisporangium rhizosphaerae]|uniref:DUF916 domain-containing protein n=1 Tax=Sphaerisporangium rhizosphaerae TaxID=2269375 RepID=A0ABW2NUJ2_9ACTN